MDAGCRRLPIGKYARDLVEMCTLKTTFLSLLFLLYASSAVFHLSGLVFDIRVSVLTNIRYFLESLFNQSHLSPTALAHIYDSYDSISDAHTRMKILYTGSSQVPSVAGRRQCEVRAHPNEAF